MGEGEGGGDKKFVWSPLPIVPPTERLCRNSFFVTLNSFQGLVTY
jgi:hypothetical protein